MRVTVACLAVSAALSAQSPHIVTSLRRAEEVALGRAIEAAYLQRRTLDKNLHWEGHFLKGHRGHTYVAFTVRIADVGERFRSAAVGVRAIGRYSRWADGYGVETEANGDHRVLRGAFSVAPGSYRVIVAVQDRAARGRSSSPLVFERQVTVPDFSGRALQISSIVAARQIDDVPEPLPRDQRKAYPYAFGPSSLEPVPGAVFTAHDNLTTAFQIYNVAMFEDGKPDVEVHYEVFREGDEQLIGKTEPQTFNQETVPDEFTLRGGFQLTPIQSLPLSRFAPGSYRLQIEVEDLLGNARVRAAVAFTVSR